MIISTARDAAALFEPMFNACAGEKVVAAHLDSEQRLIGTIEEHGSGDAVPLPIRHILGQALRLGAYGVIVAHNHPSGDPNPSVADLVATRELRATADSLGIEVHDHLVFGHAGDCRSLRALGLI